MNKYEQELQILKSHDEVQSYYQPEYAKGYYKIDTAGHGYLVVPVGDKNFGLATRTYEYGYRGNLAVYLEEDCEMSAFLERIK